MIRRVSQLFASLILISGCGGLSHPAPEYNFVGVSKVGESVPLSQLTGDVTVVTFWSSWCKSCALELNSLENMYQSGKSFGIQVVGVSIDESPAPFESFLDKHPFSFPMVRDDQLSARNLYGVKDIPFTVILNRCGQISEFPDPVTGESKASFNGMTQWDSKPVLRDLISMTRRAC